MSGRRGERDALPVSGTRPRMTFRPGPLNLGSQLVHLLLVGVGGFGMRTIGLITAIVVASGLGAARADTPDLAPFQQRLSACIAENVETVERAETSLEAG